MISTLFAVPAASAPHAGLPRLLSLCRSSELKPGELLTRRYASKSARDTTSSWQAASSAE
jgi:hypothetical protein